MIGVTTSLVTAPVPALTTGLVLRAGSAPSGTGGNATAGVCAPADGVAEPLAPGVPVFLPFQFKPMNTAAMMARISTAVMRYPPMRLRRAAAARLAAACLAKARFSGLVRACGSLPRPLLVAGAIRFAVPGFLTGL